jgi:hypothetical protein
MNFVVQWSLSGNAAPAGGFVVQDVTFVWTTNDCAGNPVPNPDARTSPLHYFEAWRVAPNSTNLSPVNTDTFFWPGSAPWAGPSSTGNVAITASATYHDNVAALPVHMVANNAATFAGGLQSSLTNPAVGGTPSAVVPHALSFSWNCCPNPSPTLLLGHTP